MPIFGINKGRVEAIPEVNFDLEKDVQNLVQNNMKKIFGVDFVTSEFQLNNLRVDSLGYDSENNSFVIFEYKRDKNFSVIDQGYAYLALLLNNKAEFVLLYNEKLSPQLKKDQVNWSQSKVVFICPSFTIYQRKAIEFKDLPIELWEVKGYSNNTILFNQIQAPQTSESISTVTEKSEVIRRVSQEVKIYSEQSHLDKGNENIKSVYKELKDAILSIGTEVTIKPTAKYIAFTSVTNFVDIVVYKGQLNLFLNMRKGTLNDPKNLARDVSSVGHWGNGDYQIVVSELSNLGYLLSLIRQSYDKNSNT
jgi:predicted transport protein